MTFLSYTSWHIMTNYDIKWYIMICPYISWHIMTFCHENKKHHFVMKARNYGIFVAKIYDYALIDSFWGSAGLIDSHFLLLFLQIFSNSFQGNITIRYCHRYLLKQTSDYVKSYWNWYFSIISNASQNTSDISITCWKVVYWCLILFLWLSSKL